MVGRSSSEQSVPGQNQGGLNPTLLAAAWVPLDVTLYSCLGMAGQGPAGRGCPRMVGAVGWWSDAPGCSRDRATISPGESATARWAESFGRPFFFFLENHKRRYKPWRLQTHLFLFMFGI